MKIKKLNTKCIFFILTSLSFISSKSQTIFPVYEIGSADKKNNFYYKDIDEFQNQFVGTWVLNEGPTYLKITFKKKPAFLESRSDISYYEDYLIGEYDYKINGTTVVNTLENLNINHSVIFNYNLYSLMRYKINQYPQCDGCDRINRLVMIFQEIPTRDQNWSAGAYFIIRRVLEQEVEKLKVQFIMTDSAGKIPNGLGDEYQGFSLPFGNYTLIKQ